MNIFEELNFTQNPYKLLGITKNSNDATIKEAYKLKKVCLSVDQKSIIEAAYNLIKNKELRDRFEILKDRPLSSLDDIKSYGFKAKNRQTGDWFKLITQGDSKT